MNARAIWKILACSAGAALLTLSSWGCVPAPASVPGTNQGITVSASSEVKVVPDKARIQVAVVSEEKTAEGCRNGNAEAVDGVLEALAKLGVDETSIQTTYANLSPRYGSRTVDGGDGESSEDWVIVGYEMTTQLSVSDLDIDSVSTVVQKCVAAGANRTDGIEYYASDYDKAYNDALAEALATARSKAEGMAAAAGVSLGGVTGIEEGYQDTSSRYVASYNEELASADDAGTGAVSKAMPGQVGITAQVNVTYSIA